MIAPRLGSPSVVFHLAKVCRRNVLIASGKMNDPVGRPRFTIPDGRAALVIAHPGHELLVHGWLELARPVIFILRMALGEQTNRGWSQRQRYSTRPARNRVRFTDALRTARHMRPFSIESLTFLSGSPANLPKH